MTGHHLADIGQSLTWSETAAFLANVPADSAIMRELHPEIYGWTTRAKTNAILADIFDMLANINANLVAVGSGRMPKRPKAYPRPWRKDRDRDTQHFGKGALPANELREWFEAKRRESHAGSCISDS